MEDISVIFHRSADYTAETSFSICVLQFIYLVNQINSLAKTAVIPHVSNWVTAVLRLAINMRAVFSFPDKFMWAVTLISINKTVELIIDKGVFIMKCALQCACQQPTYTKPRYWQLIPMGKLGRHRGCLIAADLSVVESGRYVGKSNYMEGGVLGRLSVIIWYDVILFQ